MNLKEIIDSIGIMDIYNFNDNEITGVSYDSRNVKKGDIFVCLKGETSDGHNFAKDAIEKGAVALMCEYKLNIDVPQIVVKSAKNKIADLAGLFYGYPSKNINLIGVTGTNGKTTTTHLIQRIIEENNQKCALIGTLGCKMSSSDKYIDAKHTTPQAVELQQTLKNISDKGIKNVAMEVSSHALEQNRVGKCFFNGAILTNLTQDHLDYHITMRNYFNSKAILFENLTNGAFAVINNDDVYAKEFYDRTNRSAKILTYAVKNSADVVATDIEFSIDGTKFICKTYQFEREVKLQMTGMFSVYNALAAITAGLAMGIEIDVCLKALFKTKGVTGRFEIVHKKPLVIVDYAHTPDGLENVLKSAREITPHGSNLICLFGCGGDRDTTKRPKMGKIADELSDKIVVTSDNPRTEDPNLIISDIMTGIKSIDQQRVFVEPDRRKAIEFLKIISTENDVIMVAGKGHEDYQILKDKTIHFDDKEEVQRVF